MKRIDSKYPPKGWEKIKIPKKLFFQEGPGIRKWQFTNKGIKLLNVGNINNGKIDLSATDKYISEADANGKYTHFLVNAGDLLIACSGIIVDNFHNKIAFAEQEHLPLCLNTSTMRFRPLEDDVNLNYFKYFLQTSHFSSQLQKLITGSAQLNFGPSHIKKIDFLLPPLETQKRIAEILDNAAALRDKTQQLLDEYDQLAQSIFLEMFGDPVTNPKGWEKAKTIDYCDCIVPGRDKPKSFTGDIPWVTTNDLNNLEFTEKSKLGKGLSVEEISQVRAKIIPENSIIITCVGDLGIVSINTKKMVVNQQLHTFQCSDMLNSLFLMFNLSFQKPYMYKMASSTTVPYMNKTIANGIPTIVPPINLQNQFAEKIALIEQQKALAKQELQESEDLFNCLLQRGFKGELM